MSNRPDSKASNARGITVVIRLARWTNLAAEPGPMPSTTWISPSIADSITS
jgi:hypothetical protein